MNHNSIIQTRNALTFLGKAEVEPPKAMTEAVQKHARIRSEAERLQHSGGDLGYVIHRSLSAGEDPIKDPRVTAALYADRLREPDVMAGVIAAADEEFIETMSTLLNDIVTRMRERFDAAAADIVAAREVLGDTKMTDAEEVLRLGADAATKWNQARLGLAAIENIEKAWRALSTFTQVRTDLKYRVFTIADPDFETWRTSYSSNFGGRGQRLPDIWQLLNDGVPLSLATFDEHRQRAERVAVQLAKLQEDYDQEYDSRLAGRPRPVAVRL